AERSAPGGFRPGSGQGQRPLRAACAAPRAWRWRLFRVSSAWSSLSQRRWCTLRTFFRRRETVSGYENIRWVFPMTIATSWKLSLPNAWAAAYFLIAETRLTVFWPGDTVEAGLIESRRT